MRLRGESSSSIALRVMSDRLGSFAGRFPVTHFWAGVPSPSVATGPVHSVVMLPPVKRPSSGLSDERAAASCAAVVISV